MAFLSHMHTNGQLEEIGSGVRGRQIDASRPRAPGAPVSSIG